ncbi:RING/U-box superfamily protein [Melia azedarach]|uniref:RING/U-box superfamily protein n=1 Tax=Melia azedarach TaxID=155640 RepID=A0ACC1Z2Z5_MELAZ|nr:RING/U-box superfamily protein [Melia azedarach]
MNGLERSRMWRNLKQRLGLKRMGCCGAIWSLRAQTISTILQQEEEEEEEEEENHMQSQQRRRRQMIANVETTAASASGMNLAMALQAERNLRGGGDNLGPDKNAVKTLMMLIEETDGVDWKNKKKISDVVVGVGEGSDWMCCVCMERNKGAAFIPCGHTFCRVCSREMWLNRGSCPICNRSILEILDIF